MGNSIYALAEGDTGAVRYVGKAAAPAARLREHLRSKGDTRLPRWIAAMRRKRRSIQLVILEVVPPDQSWQEREAFWIAHHLAVGCDLVNLTSGGDGLVGASLETRAKLRALRQAEWADLVIRAARLTTIRSPERRAAISTALTGRPHSADHVAKLPQNQKGRRLTPEHREKIRIGCQGKGRRWTPEEAATARLLVPEGSALGNRSRLGQKRSPEELAKTSAALKGRPKSAEHRERIRQAQLRAWARRKEAKAT